MKFKKLLISLSLIIVAIISMSGCAKVEIMRTVDSYRVIMDKLVVTLDKNKLLNNYDNVRNSVIADMITFRNYVHDWIEGYKDEYPKVYLDMKEGIICEVPESQNNELSVVITFADISFFAVFYGLADINDVEYAHAMEDVGPFIQEIFDQEYQSEEFNLFLYKYSMVSNKGLLSTVKDYKIDGIDTNYYDKYTELTGCSLSDLDVTQIFAYPDDRLYSNADVKEVVAGVTFLAWDLNDKGADFEMSIFKLAPRSSSWYMLALGISAIFVVIATIVIAVKYRNEITVKITKQDVEKNGR